MKKCFIEYSKHAVNVTVNICRTPLVKDCDSGGDEICRTEYESECVTSQGNMNKLIQLKWNFCSII